MTARKTFEDILRLASEKHSVIENNSGAKYNQSITVDADLPQEEEDMSEDIRVDEWTIDYRKRNLDRDLARIRNMAVGRYESFLPFVEDKKGRLSDRKIKGFIKDLIGSHPKAAEFTKEKRRLLESFLYCVITGPSGLHSCVQPVYLTTEYRIPGTFMEIIAAAKDPVFQEKDRLKLAYEEEQDRAYIENGHGFSFFQNMELDPDKVRSFYTPEELREASEFAGELMGEDPDDILKHWAGMSTSEEKRGTDHKAVTDDAKDNAEKVQVPVTDGPLKGLSITVSGIKTVDHLDDDDDGSANAEDAVETPVELPEPDWELMERERRWYEELEAKAMEEYRNHLPKDCHLQDTYLDLRKMLYNVDYSGMAETVSEMVDAYLISHDISPLCYKKGYGLVSEKISRFVDEIDHAVERARIYR